MKLECLVTAEHIGHILALCLRQISSLCKAIQPPSIMQRPRSHKLSTNERFGSIINGPDEAEVDDNQGYLRKERRAKAALQRSRLYGCGARALLPRVRKPKPKSQSPFFVSVYESAVNQGDFRREDSAVPPGSHADMYRLVYNSKFEPFYTTSSMTEGVRVVSQPPWYFGNNNKVRPSDSTMVNAASRYGYRGARNILRYNTAPCDPSFRTLSPHQLAFLKKKGVIANEFVPNMVASPIQTVNNLETPKLWPENTLYAFGSPLKTKPSSPSYRRETTVGDPLPVPSRSLTRALNKYEEEINILDDYGKLESSRLLLSRPLTAKLEFETKWSDRVAKTANSTLRATMSREVPPCQKHGLMDSSDTINSSLGGSYSIIVHTQSAQEFQFRYQIKQNHSNTPYNKVWRSLFPRRKLLFSCVFKRWKQVYRTFALIKSILKRDQPFHIALEEMCRILKYQTQKVSATGSMIRKADFLSAFQSSKMFEGLKDKQLSLLYSAFDHNRKNLVLYVSIIVPLAILDQAESKTPSQLQRIAFIWDLYSDNCADMPPIDRAFAVVTAACGDDVEFYAVKSLFRKDFELAAFHLGLVTDFESTLAKGMRALSMGASPEAEALGNLPQEDYDYAMVSYEPASYSRSGNVVNDLPVHSICGSSAMTRDIFVSLLVSCDDLLNLISKQYRQRYLDYMSLVQDAAV